MNTGMKITAFAAALTATFGAAYAAGAGIGPLDTEPEPAAHSAHSDHSGHDGKAKDGAGGDEEPPGGLQISDGGYTFALKTPRLEADEKETLSFALLGPDGEPLTEYRREHGKELHLIVASRDLMTYRHVHPDRAEDGTWSVDVELPAAGDYRLFADFKPAAKGADALTLGADLAVSGDYDAEALPEQSATAKVEDYTVTLDGDLTAGRATALNLTVEKDGKPVTDLDPYLGAYGHLVALRAGDLAYLHVHPNGEPGDGSTRPGPEVSFTATAPSAGAYRLFLDFQHEGEVRTAAFTVQASAAEGETTPEETAGETGKSEQHEDSGEEEAGGHEH